MNKEKSKVIAKGKCECGKKADYGYDDDKPLCCENCSSSDMILVVSKRYLCDCGKRTSYGLIYKKALYCNDCAKEGMLNVLNDRCEKCTKRASLRLPGENKARFCKDHAPKNAKNNTKKKCIFEGCTTGKPALFNIKGKTPEYCVKHRTKDMINIYAPICKECTKEATFNYPNETKRLYCSDHKLEGMISLKKKCCYLGCPKTPSFGDINEKKRKYCFDHKPEGMICIAVKLCIGEDKKGKCTRQPYYNFENEKPLYCSTHALDGMILVKKMTCVCCDIQPNFNFPGEIKGKYCEKHAIDGMRNVKQKVCKKCGVRASYGPLFSKKIHCAKHKENNEYINNKPKCIGKNCTENALYTNKNNNYPLRCEDHKIKKSDKNVIEKPCKFCGLSWHIRDGLDFCNDCYDYNYKKVHKIQEEKILAFLKANQLQYIYNDEKVKEGCSLYRPDFVFDNETFMVVLEIDEHQHESYSKNCELARMVQLFQDFGGIPVVFIRFNPDSYIDNEGNVCDSYIGRRNLLLRVLKGLRNEESIKEPLSIIYLYYDGFDGKINRQLIDFEKDLENISIKEI